MSMLRSLSSFTQSSLRQLTFTPQVTAARWLQTGTPTLGMPGMKKRMTVDPAIVRAREERRVRRITKALRKMKEKNRILKPLVEVEVDPKIAREREERTRKVEISEETEDERALLLKEWSRQMGRRHKEEIRCIDRVIMCQQRALDELRAISPQLYAKAIEFDDSLLPFTCRGPTRTPPIPGHLVDGEYKDQTRQFQVQYADMKKFLNELLLNPRIKQKREEMKAAKEAGLI